MWASLRPRDPRTVPSTPTTPPPFGSTDLTLHLINALRGRFPFPPAPLKKLKMETKSQGSGTKERERNGEKSRRRRKQQRSLQWRQPSGRHTLPGGCGERPLCSSARLAEVRPAPLHPPDPGPCRSLLRAPDWVWRLLGSPNPSPTSPACQWSSPAGRGGCRGGSTAPYPSPYPNTRGHTCGVGLGWALQWAFWHYRPLAICPGCS